MNTKLFLTVTIFVAVLAGFFAFATMTKSAPAQVPASTSRLGIVVEPGIRMWSGAIEFSDSNYADFRPHIQTPAEQTVSLECMVDEQVAPRRYGGCIQ